MTDIAGFSEAARLYAVNEPVVLAMAEHLKADAAKFWEAVEAHLGRRFESATISLTTTAGYSYFTLKEGDAPRCSVWVRRTDGQIVREATVVTGFGIACATTDNDRLAAGVALANDIPDLGRKSVRARKKPTPGTLFDIDLQLDPAAPIESFCERVEPILEKLRTLAAAPAPAP